MKFGICASVNESPAVKAAGWDYVEANVQALLRGTTSDADWQTQRPQNLPLPVPAANSLVPADLKITGPNADAQKLHNYMKTVLRRAKTVGIELLVFGSGAARNVPEDFERDLAERQIRAFAADSARLAAEQNITLVLEPLNRGECNIINTLDEGMHYVRAVNHPNFQILLDTYHFWLENEPLANLNPAMPHLRHVHLADKEGRVAPGLSGRADYKPVFTALKRGGYNGMISFEGTPMNDFDKTAPRVLEYVKAQWAQA